MDLTSLASSFDAATRLIRRSHLRSLSPFSLFLLQRRQKRTQLKPSIESSRLCLPVCDKSPHRSVGVRTIKYIWWPRATAPHLERKSATTAPVAGSIS